MDTKTQIALAQIHTVYPEFQAQSARWLTGMGQFSNILVIDERLIFRFPRSIPVAREMRRELDILHVLQGRTTLTIPRPLYTHFDEDIVTFMGYPIIPGQPVMHDSLKDADDPTLRRFAEQLVEFMRELHAVPLDLFEVPPTTTSFREDWARFFMKIRAALFAYMRPDAQKQVTATFEAALADESLWDFTPLMHHGDFGTRNILYDPAAMRVTGIIDFSTAGIGDPAQDIGALWSLGDPLMAHILDLYPEMRAHLRRVAFIRSTYALQQALFALRDGDQDEFDNGIQDYR